MRNSFKNASRWTVVLGCLMTLTVGLTACNDDETYADQKKRERKAVEAFISRNPLVLTNGVGDTLLNTPGINLISEDQFERQDSMTDVSRNEYVTFSSTGIYMQIVRQGTGKRLEEGDRATLAARYFEFNIMTDSLLSTNKIPLYNPAPDYIDVSNTYGTINGSFNTEIYPGGGAMYHTYGTTTVPSGWLVPLQYVKIGQQSKGDNEIAKVRLIVPHSSGTPVATNSVYPCFYEIEFQRVN